MISKLLAGKNIYFKSKINYFKVYDMEKLMLLSAFIKNASRLSVLCFLFLSILVLKASSFFYNLFSTEYYRYALK